MHESFINSLFFSNQDLKHILCLILKRYCKPALKVKLKFTWKKKINIFFDSHPILANRGDISCKLKCTGAVCYRFSFTVCFLFVYLGEKIYEETWRKSPCLKKFLKDSQPSEILCRYLEFLSVLIALHPWEAFWGWGPIYFLKSMSKLIFSKYLLSDNCHKL